MYTPVQSPNPKLTPKQKKKKVCTKVHECSFRLFFGPFTRDVFIFVLPTLLHARRCKPKDRQRRRKHRMILLSLSFWGKVWIGEDGPPSANTHSEHESMWKDMQHCALDFYISFLFFMVHGKCPSRAYNWHAWVLFSLTCTPVHLC